VRLWGCAAAFEGGGGFVGGVRRFRGEVGERCVPDEVVAGITSGPSHASGIEFPGTNRRTNDIDAAFFPMDRDLGLPFPVRETDRLCCWQRSPGEWNPHPPPVEAEGRAILIRNEHDIPMSIRGDPKRDDAQPRLCLREKGEHSG
jgi:hypothetical protein